MMGHHDAGPLISLLLGLGLGARHAIEPDHVAAIGTLATQRPGLRRGALLGLLWGLGHALSLLAVGLSLAVLSARVPAALADTLELGVAVMLMALGFRGLLHALHDEQPLATSLHRHGSIGHQHAGATAHVHVGRRVLSRPLVVGMMHGLAGSGALTALAMAELPTTGSRLAFLTLFGLGSLLGMVAISGLWGWPLAHLSRRPLAARWIGGATGLCSAAVGLLWGAAAIGRILA